MSTTPTAPAFDALPLRIFLDSCTVQTLGKYGEFIYDGEPIGDDDRIHRMPDGLENLLALRNICWVTSRALFPWIVSRASYREARAKGDANHLSWFREVADYAWSFLEGDDRLSPQEAALATRLSEPKFGYLGAGDRILLRDAISTRCDCFLTVERKLCHTTSWSENPEFGA